MRLTPIYYVYATLMCAGWASAGLCLASDFVLTSVACGAAGIVGFLGTQQFNPYE